MYLKTEAGEFIHNGAVIQSRRPPPPAASAARSPPPARYAGQVPDILGGISIAEDAKYRAGAQCPHG